MWGFVAEEVKKILVEFWELPKKMKIAFFLILAVCLCLGVVALVGCTPLNPSAAYIEANYKNSETAIPDHIEYIQDDNELPESSKKIRIKSLKEWQKMNKDFYEELKKQ